VESEIESRSTDDLIEIALTAPIDEDEIQSLGWDAIWALRYRGTRDVLQATRTLCLSDDVNGRRVGADILGQLGIPTRTFPDECLGILLVLLDDKDLDVVNSACVALGHLHQPGAIGSLIKLKGHPDASIRYSVTFGLLGYEDARAIQALIELSEDEDDDVRDWATFGLGSQIDIDTPQIRDALYRRLFDPFENVIGEAMVGLARRKDERLLEMLLHDFMEHDDIGDLPLEAAGEFADPRLYPALVDLRRRWIEQDDYAYMDELDIAIATCAP
jgi:HEAT repeat protein